MRKLVLLAAFVGLLVAGDLVATRVAEGALSDRAREAAGGAASAEATITSWPFVGRLLASGRVARVEVRVEGMSAGPLRLASVEVDASGVAVDRGALFSGGVRLEGIERGSVTVELDAGALAGTLDLPVTIEDGQVRVEVAGVAATARVDVGPEGGLVLRAAGLPGLTVPIVRTRLNPCEATSVAVEGDRVRLTCELDELPEILRR